MSQNISISSKQARVIRYASDVICDVYVFTALICIVGIGSRMYGMYMYMGMWICMYIIVFSCCRTTADSVGVVPYFQGCGVWHSTILLSHLKIICFYR